MSARRGRFQRGIPTKGNCEMGKSKISRRGFLNLAAAGAAAPYIVPASALGRDGATAPSERIVMGGIGLGNRGTGVFRSWILHEKDVQFVAICDVQKKARERIKNLTDEKYGNKDCATYIDMREMLARKDIDAVFIATSDRWHASASVLAMRAGKDVYCEKPASMTVREGQALVAEAQRSGRVFQGGMQRLSEPNFVVCNELLRTGRLGEVKKVHAHMAPWGTVFLDRKWWPEQPQPPREEVDWDGWLGPCPWRPFNEHYLRGGWHSHHDLYTGVLGEWGSHTFAQCHDALGCAGTSPVFYPCLHKALPEGISLRFANGVEMVSSQEGWRGTCGVRYEGSEGWVSCADGYSRPEVSKPSLLADYEKLLGEYCERTGYTGQNHMRQFFNAVRNRSRTIADAVMTHRSMSTVHCANIAQWVGRDLTWDPVKEEFVNDPEANRMLSRAQREGWQII